MKYLDDDILIVSAARTPFGRFGGSLKNIDCYELGAMPIREILKRASIDPSMVDDIYWGMGDTSSCRDVYTPIAGRQSALKAGIPVTTPACTIDKACVSGTSAIILGARSLKLGECSVALAGGATTFSQEPFILRGVRFEGHKMGNLTIEDPLFGLGYKDYNPVAVDAGERALVHKISREEQDEWAIRSHQLYGDAYGKEKFKDEMVAVNYSHNPDKPEYLDIDEQYRKNISLEKLSQLKTVFNSATVTAGNAPGMNDGSAAMILVKGKRARELKIEPIAKIVSYRCVAGETGHIPEIPAEATIQALKIADLSVKDIDLFEINEAFAVMPLVSTKILGENDPQAISKLREKTNVNGGAIAIGHANTATGVRLVMTLAYELRRRGGGRGVAAICGGLGQGDAIVVEV